MSLVSKRRALPQPPAEGAWFEASHGHESDRLRRKSLLQRSPVFILPRRLPGGVAAAIDALSPETLPRFSGEGPLDGVASQLKSVIAAGPIKPRWLIAWLVADVIEHATLMIELTGAPELRIRLDVVDDDRCRIFHVDRVRLRLLTTYRGPGTEWVPPKIAAKLAPGAEPPEDVIRHLARGEVAVLRGSQGATPDRPGVLHRSPRIASLGLSRLLLVIDEVGRQLH